MEGDDDGAGLALSELWQQCSALDWDTCRRIYMRNWTEIGRRHYVRRATADNHWFDFMRAKVRTYSAKFGDDFCLVINGSESEDDAYVIPWKVAKDVFTDSSIANDERGRWIGTIRGSTLTLAPNGESLNVRPYHNTFELLSTNGALDGLADEGPLSAAAEIQDAVETTLHLEGDLENFLVADLNQLERGLTLFEADGKLGRQLSAGPAGRIDILALDSSGALVVIEVKAGEADRQVCGQIQAYMGWVKERIAAGRPVRGVIVASGFTERMKLAAGIIPTLSLKEYAVVFRFRDAGN